MGQVYDKSEFPAAQYDFSVALNAFREGIKRELFFCFPASILSYDRVTGKATVLPLVKLVCFNGEYYTLPRQPYEVTVRRIACGGITIDIPLYEGDTGWVIASDRDTAILKDPSSVTASVLASDRDKQIIDTEYQQPPNLTILHSLQAGFFLPDNWGRMEGWRYKDAPGGSIGNGLYIGTSFDTADKYQSGDHYEKSGSASLLIQPGGAVSLGSATPAAEEDSSATDEENYAAAVENAERKGVIKAEDGVCALISSADAVAAESAVKVSCVDGISLRTTDMENSASISLKKGAMTLLVRRENSYVTIVMNDGEISITSSGGVNIAADSANVVTRNGANVVTGADAVVNAGGCVNLNSADAVNLNAASTANINASGDVRVATQSNAYVAARQNIEACAGEDVIATAKKGDVLVEAKEGDVDVLAEKGEVTIKGKTVTIEGENVSIEGTNSVTVTSPDTKGGK